MITIAFDSYVCDCMKFPMIEALKDGWKDSVGGGGWMVMPLPVAVTLDL